MIILLKFLCLPKPVARQSREKPEVRSRLLHSRTLDRPVKATRPALPRTRFPLPFTPDRTVPIHRTFRG